MPRRSSYLLWPCLTVAALLAMAPVRAGELRAPFTITVRMLPPSDSCSAAAEGPTALVSCGAPPQVAQVRLQDAFPFLREQHRLGAAEAGALLFQTTTVEHWRSSQLYGEYSTRTVQIQGVEYVEMLLSW